MKQRDLENIEIDLLIEAILRRYGHDFRHYSKETLRRRILGNLSDAGLNNISELIPRVLNSKSCFEKLFYNISITVTEMFRDPGFYLALRERIIPVLKTYPFIKIWHAGCATGQEVYSLAILLKEEGCYDRSQIYATDFNDAALARAKNGIYCAKSIKEYTSNYQQAGGIESFADYYRANYDSVIMDAALKKNITFANHNLVTDSTFGEMNLILCRNVLIYFDDVLQARVLSMFEESLCQNGLLCLGSNESLSFSEAGDGFSKYIAQEKIYQKMARKPSTKVRSGV